jgi:hypothetical protein
MSQVKYTWNILKNFNMVSCKSFSTPLEISLKFYGNDDFNQVNSTPYCQLVGTLIYPTTTRPYIFFVVNMVS